MVVGNRIKRLLEHNIIDYFYVKTKPSSLGFMHLKIYLRLHNITKEKSDKLVKELTQKKGIFWFCTLRGKYDLVLSIYVKNIFDFSEQYHTLFDKWGNYILERNVIILERGSTYNKTYFLPHKKKGEFVYTKGEKQVTLDNLDQKMLKILNKNGRMSLLKIAQKIKTSADTVRNRIKRLKEKGVIAGFGTKINFEKLGYSYHILFLKLQNMTAQKYQKLETLAKLNKNTIIFLKSIGSHDVELEIETSKKQELDHLIHALRDQFVNEIKDYELLEVTKEHRMTYFPF